MLIAAVLILAIPALAFALFPLFRRTEEPAPISDESSVQALMEEKVQLLRAIRELEFDHQAGHLSSEDYQQVRARYETRVATLLEEIDRRGREVVPKPRKAGAEREQVGQTRPAAPVARVAQWTRRPLWILSGCVVLVGFGLTLGLLLSRSLGPDPNAPVGGMSGGTRPQGGGMPPAGGVTSTLEEGTGSRPLDPGTLAGMLGAARQALEAGQFNQAIPAYKAILKHDPNNVEAITYLGVILGIANHADGALEAFDKALRVNPKYPDALFHKGRILYEAKQDYPKAIKTLEAYLTVAPTPEARTQAQLLLQEAKARMLPGAKPAPPK